jgi:hypothetical protein
MMRGLGIISHHLQVVRKKTDAPLYGFINAKCVRYMSKPAVFVDKTTRLIVQGITGKNGTFHTEQAIEYGTKVELPLRKVELNILAFLCSIQLLKQRRE